MNLILKIKVADRVEAYRLTNFLAAQYDLTEAEYNKEKQKFDKDNKPSNFLKNNETNK